MSGREPNIGQSSVIGVALLLAITVISMGTLTAAVGVLVDENAAEANAERVASDFDRAFDPVTASGSRRGSVSFSEGSIRSVDRTIEVRIDGAVAHRVAVDALVFESGDRRVVFHSGAIVRGGPGWAWMDSPPPITIDREFVILGISRLGPNPGTISGSGGVTATIETHVEHRRYELDESTISIAIETATPGPWERYFQDVGATVDRETGDPPIVVAEFEGDRTGYLVVHDLNTEVNPGV